MSWLLALLGPIGSLITGFFKTKEASILLEQTEVLADASVTKTAIETQPELITAEGSPSNSFLSRNIRGYSIAALMLYTLGRLLGFLDAHVPPEYELYCLQGTFGLMGIMFSLRTVEKWRSMGTKRRDI